MLMVFGLTIVVCATIRFTVENKGAYMFEIFMANTCVGGLMVITPTALQVMLGPQTGSNIYCFFWCSIAASNFIQFIFVEFLAK